MCVLSQFYLAVCFITISILSNVCTERLNNDSTGISAETDKRLLVFATLDGSLIGVNQQTGEIQWRIKDKPIVKVPLDTENLFLPTFLPDPKDGSLYLIGSAKEPLRKLPFTIPELVSASPCRSSDGILYTGKKKDTWYMLNPHTGERQQILGWEKVEATCPIDNDDVIYLGRTKYSIMMVDIHNPQRKWNITFYDYAAAPMDKEGIQNYDLVHFTSSSSGRVLTMDRRRGSLLWDLDLGSPVTGVYILDPNGLLIVPFTSLANHTLSHLATYFLDNQQPFQSPPGHMKLYPTLYVGEHVYGLYALSSLVDQNVVTIISSEVGPLLLTGPNAPDCPRPYPEYLVPGKNYRVFSDSYNADTLTFQSIRDFGDHIIFVGHYNVPEYSDTRFLINGRDYHVKLLTDASDENDEFKRDFIFDNTKSTSSIGVQTDDDEEEATASGFLYKSSLKVMFNSTRAFISQQENKGLKFMLIILIGCVIAMFFYLQIQVREFQQLSQNGSKSSQQSSVGKNGSITASVEELPDGLMRVGKITFHPEHLLGKGCEGTFVYRGEFDARKVAVKRLLPECFTFADREVALLRESDAHPNVVRYYCTEQDRMFRYIALELCQATLSDYVQGICDRSLIKLMDILRQATSGLEHLHTLGIVHRDIKPHNVLLSMPDNHGRVYAMISDFGLCKKLQVGRVSFSRRSGVTGTDGWIAPEMLNGKERITCAIDLFSLGCLFYYVLSNGGHPFGEALRRQANILCGEFSLKDLSGPDEHSVMQKLLVSALISSQVPERPPCATVLTFPMFWDKAKILAFFQDVSDRVEKLELDDPVLQALESKGNIVVRGNWQAYIDDEVASDLKKYRSYRGESVRDLLRALRNKKHHFRELTAEAQAALGDIPDHFTDYWTKRFPLLLIHSWLAMQCVAHEKPFTHYYTPVYRFSRNLESFCDNIEIDYDLVANDFVWRSPKKSIKDKNLKKFSRKYDISNKSKLSYLTEDLPRENVGLYRNLKLPVDDHFSKRSRTIGTKSKVGKKTVDEPLVWAISEEKKVE